MRLFIEPTEPLLFRTGRPFDAGESNFAESIFPPTPETIQGAIRATIATHWDTTKNLQELFQEEALTELIGYGTKYGRFRITNIALGQRKNGGKKEDEAEEAQEDLATHPIECLYPMPANIMQKEEDEEQLVRLIPQKKPDHIYTNPPDHKYHLYQNEESGGKPTTEKYWVTKQGLWQALMTSDVVSSKHIVKEKDICTREPRLGIGMNNKTKTSEEGLLYQVHMIRMNHIMGHNYTYGFVVDVRLTESSDTVTYPEPLLDDSKTQELLRLPNRGWLTLGGEQRAARFEVIKPVETEQSEYPELPVRGNLLYLATPAAFDRGWQPDAWTNWAEPVTAAIEHFQTIGGWLLTPGSAGGKNKIQRRCVPAGSIYFFKEKVSTAFPFTNHGKEIGYGITFAGEWNV